MRKLLSKKWREQNNRRIDLIFKQRDSDLTPEEEAELAGLQEIVGDGLNQVYPLPFEPLKAWEDAAAALKPRKQCH